MKEVCQDRFETKKLLEDQQGWERDLQEGVGNG